jgi:hypothetical protein
LSRAERWLTGLIALFGIPVHIAGILNPSVYRDPPLLVPQNRATDVVTLVVGIPLLVGTAIATARGSRQGRILWLGALGFLLYDYGMYALGVRWQPLFLAYLALFGLSLYGTVIGFIRTDPDRINPVVETGTPRKSVAAYLIGVALVVGSVWLSEEIGATAGGATPKSVIEFETPTNIVHVFDLAIVLPAMIVAAVMLLRRKPWGFVLSGVLLVKAATIGLWVLVMMWFMAGAGYPVVMPQLILFAGLTAMGAYLAWVHLSSIPSVRPESTLCPLSPNS